MQVIKEMVQKVASTGEVNEDSVGTDASDLRDAGTNKRKYRKHRETLEAEARKYSAAHAENDVAQTENMEKHRLE